MVPTLHTEAFIVFVVHLKDLPLSLNGKRCFVNPCKGILSMKLITMMKLLKYLCYSYVIYYTEKDVTTCYSYICHDNHIAVFQV